MSTTTEERKLPIAVEDILDRHEGRLEAIYSAVSGLEGHPPAASGVMDIISETKKLLRREMEGVDLSVRRNGRGERPHGDRSRLSLDEEDIRALNVLIAAVELAGDGELGNIVGGPRDRTPTGLRRVWRKLRDHVEPTIRKLEDAHPLSGEELTTDRGDVVFRLAREVGEVDS